MSLVPSIPHLDRLVDLARKECRAFEHLQRLCDDVGPRMPCTPGDVAAIAWAKATMRGAGLANVRTEAAPASVWKRGEREDETCRMTLPWEKPLVCTALGGSVGTPSEGITADLIAFRSLEELDAAPFDQVNGRIVLLHHRMLPLQDGTGYNEASVVRTSGPSRAAKKGAMACLVSSAGTSGAAHTGALRYEPDANLIPAAALSREDADILLDIYSRGERVVVSLKLGCSSMPVGESANVLGEVAGSDRAQEIVLLGAHLDSWDLGTGALDDGAGCAIAIEVARLIAALPDRPRRTVRIVLFANAEMGTGGGLAYASAHAAETPRHVVAMEADQGDGQPWALRVPALAGEHPVTKALCQNLAPLGIALDPGISRGGADIAPLRQIGVPFVDLQQDMTNYFYFHHTQSDVLESVNRPDLDAATLAFAVAVWVLSNAEGDFRGK